MPLDYLVFLGTVRRDRLGLRVARFVVDSCRSRGHAATLVDPMELDFPLLDRMYKEYPPGEAPPKMAALAGQIRAADGFLVVSAEYNHSIPPALSNTLDHFLEEYAKRPSGIVCYSASPYGGVRAAMQLRAMLAELGTPSIPTLFPVPSAGQAFSPEGEPTDPKAHGRVAKFLDELDWYAEALKRHPK